MLDQTQSGDQTMVPDVSLAALLKRLEALESQLYSQEVEEAVKAALKDQPDQQSAFVQARLGLTATILKLKASQLSEIREDLQAKANELNQGIDELAGACGRLEAAVTWTQALNGVISAVGKIVSLV
jgi:hypothetical protein